MAESVGFEPTEVCTSRVFKTLALNHSANSPGSTLCHGLPARVYFGLELHATPRTTPWSHGFIVRWGMATNPDDVAHPSVVPGIPGIPGMIPEFIRNGAPRKREECRLRWSGGTGATGGAMPKFFQVMISDPRLGDLQHGPPATFAEAMQAAHHLKTLHPTQRVFIQNGANETVYDLKQGCSP